MQKKDIVKIINQTLKNSWSADDIRNGKNIHCLPSWTTALRDVVPMYRDKGWVVKKLLSISTKGRKLTLNFKHPTWSEKQKHNSNL
jgi:hypothetical protein